MPGDHDAAGMAGASAPCSATRQLEDGSALLLEDGSRLLLKDGSRLLLSQGGALQINPSPDQPLR